MHEESDIARFAPFASSRVRGVRFATLLILSTLVAAPMATAAPVTVDVGVLLINFGNYDANKGTYTLDFYLWMRWDATAAPAGFTPEKFEFMNGRATAKEKILDETNATTGEREMWWRVQAALYSDPRFDRYPYDAQTIEVVFEDAIYPIEALVYAPLEEESGLDDAFRIAGWRILDDGFALREKEYKFGETYSRAAFTIAVAREPLSSTLRTFLPPIAFSLVAALGFFFHPSKVANRVALGTGMLISSVLYHISQTVALPPLGRLTLFDKVMLAEYTFVVCTLAVATLIAIDEDFWKDRDYTKKINVWGAVASIVLPFLVFAVLWAL